METEKEIFNPSMDLTVRFSGFKEDLYERYLLYDNTKKIYIDGNTPMEKLYIKLIEIFWILILI